MSNFVGEKVNHTTWGAGVITSERNGIISVKFDGVSNEKKLTLGAIGKHLFFVDSTVELSITDGDPIKIAKTDKAVMDFFERCEKSLQKEIHYLRTNGGKKQTLLDGKIIEKKGKTFIYSFEADSELNYPDDTQITIHREPKIQGKILFCEDFTVTLASPEYLGDSVAVLEISAEPWMLLAFLIERLNSLKDNLKHPIVRRLITEGKNNIQDNIPITKGQENAIKMAKYQPITFIWGPPGTGKTQTLANIALNFIKAGKRILMLSYSNVSVDGAVLRVHQLDKNKTPGEILRYGYARDKSITEHEYLSAYNYVIRQHPELYEKYRKLVNDKNKIVDKKSKKFIEIQNEIKAIRQRISDEEKQAVQSARFVATTVSKAIADKTVYKDNYDVIIFDEASMAFIPQIIASAGLAREHFVCLGDFNQLPPIVQSDDEFISVDIFHYCRIREAVGMNKGHKWLCLLDTQYRMHPEIADFASASMYNHMLLSNKDMNKRREGIVHSAPFSDKSVYLADLTGLVSMCTQTLDKSRINPLSAFISLGLALKAAEKNSVGIISPYNAHARLLNSMVRDVMAADSNINNITCATVHQFQGSEKDVIIYDSVDCYIQKYPGTLITNTKNNYANRLFNVALTRARGKFIAVSNVGYMENKISSDKLMFKKLIKKEKHNFNFSALINELQSTKSDCFKLYSTQHYADYLQDIVQAKKSVKIDIPDPMSKDETFVKALEQALSVAHKKGLKVVIRSSKKDGLPTEIRKMAVENQFLYNPITIIDDRIVWFGQPLSEANFISEGITIKTKYHPVIRFVGKNTAASLYGFLSMSKTTDSYIGRGDSDTFASYIAANCKCKKCGRPLKLIKSKANKFFLSCSGYPHCSGSEWITEELIEDYLYHKSNEGLRCKICNKSLEPAKGKWGMYVRCCGLHQHTYSLDSI